MKKALALALAAGGLMGSAQAASSLSVYGVVDLAVERVSSLSPGGVSVTRMPNLTGLNPSRLGFRGREDLGSGLHVSYALEMGLGADTGAFNQGGRGFGRQSWVGLGGAWGTVTLGRQYTMMGTVTSAGDFMSPSAHSIAAIDGYYPNARFDNALGYRGKFGGLTVGAVYSLGRDAVNAGPSPAGTNCAGESATDVRACRAWSAAVRYDAKNWGAAIGTDVLRGGPGAFGGLNSSAMKDKRVAVSGYYQFDKLKLGAVHIQRDNGASRATPRSNVSLLSASYAVTPKFTLTGQAIYYKLKNSNDSARMAALRGTYAFSKRTSVYASVSRMENKGNANFSASSAQAGGNSARGGKQNGLILGISHSF